MAYKDDGNDKYLKTQNAVFPNWKIVAGKFIRVSFNFVTGERHVILEKFPDTLHGGRKSTGLKMSTTEWHFFKLALDLVFIRLVHVSFI